MMSRALMRVNVGIRKLADQEYVHVDAIKTGEFDTVLGKVKMVDNIRQDVWWAGQWQGGEFYGLGPTSIAGAKEPLFPKPDWKK